MTKVTKIVAGIRDFDPYEDIEGLQPASRCNIPRVSLAETHDPEWRSERQKRRQGIDDLVALIPPDGAREFDERDMMLFFEQLAEGYGPMEIGLSMGWSPSMVNRFTADPERKALIDMIVDAEHESVERAIKVHAIAGNSTAMKMYAYNRMQHRGWADRSEVRINHQGQQELVVTVRQQLEAHTRELMQGDGGVETLQMLGELTPDAGAHDDDDDIADGEIVD